LIAAVQEQVKARAAAMREQPAAAAAEAGLLAESLAPLAEKPGSPFDGLLGTVKEIQASLGPRPSPKAVQEAAARLTDEAAKLAP
jgi:hypothetical protein